MSDDKVNGIEPWRKYLAECSGPGCLRDHQHNYWWWQATAQARYDTLNRLLELDAPRIIVDKQRLMFLETELELREARERGGW